jgi:beta-glucosidase
LSLPEPQDSLISAVAAANPNTIVVLNGPGPVLMPWASAVKAILFGFFPGQESGVFSLTICIFVCIFIVYAF